MTSQQLAESWEVCHLVAWELLHVAHTPRLQRSQWQLPCVLTKNQISHLTWITKPTSFRTRCCSAKSFCSVFGMLLFRPSSEVVGRPCEPGCVGQELGWCSPSSCHIQACYSEHLLHPTSCGKKCFLQTVMGVISQFFFHTSFFSFKSRSSKSCSLVNSSFKF